MTLQLNKEQTVVKEDNRLDAWEVIFLLYIWDCRKMCSVFTLQLVTHVVVCHTFCLVANTGWHYLYPQRSCVGNTLPWVMAAMAWTWWANVRQRKKLERRNTWVEREEEIKRSQKSADYHLLISGLLSWSQPVLSLKQVFIVTWLFRIFLVKLQTCGRKTPFCFGLNVT